MTSITALHRPLIAALLPVAFVVVTPIAHAQSAPAPQGPSDPYDSGDDYDSDSGAPGDDQPLEAEPEQPAPAAPPNLQPPAPPRAAPPVEATRAAPPPPPQGAPSPVTGQWVYTQQYGWVWAPYGNQYTYAPGDAAYPYAYIYRPAYGWAWLSAPWVWGWGPRVYFSVGPRYFHWYHRPFIRGPVIRGFRGGFRAPHITGSIGGRFGAHRGRR